MRLVLGSYMRIYIHIDVYVPFLDAVVLPAGATRCVVGGGRCKLVLLLLAAWC